MKVALLSPFLYPIAEPFAGGTEAFLFRLAIALVRRGVEVVCYGCEGTNIPGVEVRTCGVDREALVTPQGKRTGKEGPLATGDMVAWAVVDDVCHDPSIDLLHNNSFFSSMLFLSTVARIPVLHTLHLPPDKVMVRALRVCRDRNRELRLVAGSQAHAQLWEPYYPVSQVVYYRFDTDALPPCNTIHEGRLAFVGRIDPSKGIEDAIEVAVLLGKPLDIYGAPQSDRISYFEDRIQPLIQRHANITYHGLVTQSVLLQGLRRAQALLFPIKWDEPFGYVAIEAMSVGTPVIMYDRGAAREIIAEGMNGFIVPSDNPRGMAQAVERTLSIDRAKCAEDARKKYHVDISAKEYQELYMSILRDRAF